RPGLHTGRVATQETCGRGHGRSPQRLDLDVLEPARRAVVLQADVALPRMVLVGDVELVLRAIGADVRLRPLVGVHPRHLLAVQLHGDYVLIAGDDDVVPLSHRLQHLLARLDQIVDRAGVVVAGPASVVDGDLQPVEADVLALPRCQGRGTDEDAAVASFRDL